MSSTAYLRFVEECHARGLGVIQDVVYNHFGPDGNYLPRFGPYLDDSAGGGGDFAAQAELAAIGRVDPITYSAYEKYRIPGFA